MFCLYFLIFRCYKIQTTEILQDLLRKLILDDTHLIDLILSNLTTKPDTSDRTMDYYFIMYILWYYWEEQQKTKKP